MTAAGSCEQRWAGQICKVPYSCAIQTPSDSHSHIFAGTIIHSPQSVRCLDLVWIDTRHNLLQKPERHQLASKHCLVSQHGICPVSRAACIPVPQR